VWACPIYLWKYPIWPGNHGTHRNYSSREVAKFIMDRTKHTPPLREPTREELKDYLVAILILKSNLRKEDVVAAAALLKDLMEVIDFSDHLDYASSVRERCSR